MYNKILIAAAFMLGMCTTAFAENNVDITGSGMIINGVQAIFEDAPVKYGGIAYVPLDDSLSACGYSLGWDNYIKATVCEKYGSPASYVFTSGNDHMIGYGMYHYEHPVMIVNGKTYIESNMFEDITGFKVHSAYGLKGMRIPDTYRLSVWQTESHGKITILNRSFLFSSETVSRQDAYEYAGIVNSFAGELPGVNVYNMLVPETGEFYASNEYYKDQLTAFEYVFEQLKNVTPVPVAYDLIEHSGEKIYFSTDHHWTQRGAYYAWRRFMDIKGEHIPPMESFKTDNRDDLKGSLVSELERIGVYNAVDVKSELFERFLPDYDVQVDVYNDAKMQDFAAQIPLINTDSNVYGSFIYGDSPITVISNGIKNGRKLVMLKESMGNALSTWSCNNYETVYVIDIRGFKDGSFSIKDFYNMTGFDDLLIESYATTVASDDLRQYLALLL